jgi:hypothetical protein
LVEEEGMDRAVMRDEAIHFSEEQGLYGFHEASAKSGENVNCIFDQVSEILCEKFESVSSDMLTSNFELQ